MRLWRCSAVDSFNISTCFSPSSCRTVDHAALPPSSIDLRNKGLIYTCTSLRFCKFWSPGGSVFTLKQTTVPNFFSRRNLYHPFVLIQLYPVSSTIQASPIISRLLNHSNFFCRSVQEFSIRQCNCGKSHIHDGLHNQSV